MKTQSDKAKVTALLFGTLLVLAALAPENGFPQAPFYEGKTGGAHRSPRRRAARELRVKAMGHF